MAKPFPLDPLIDLARERADDAAKQLGLLNKALSEANAKLELLLQYQREYQGRFDDSMRRGVTPNELRNFQEFLKKIEYAINEQKKQVQLCEQNLLAGQLEWQEKQRKLKSFETLSDRHKLQQAKTEAKREQKAQDEYSGKLYQQQQKKDLE